MSEISPFRSSLVFSFLIIALLCNGFSFVGRFRLRFVQVLSMLALHLFFVVLQIGNKVFD